MINFIVCDDNKKVLNNVEGVIDKEMLKNNISYHKHLYSDYDSNFKTIINSKLANKIYILDIETPSASGIDIARYIREKDTDSIIIFMTIHNELGPRLLYDEIMFLTFINKYDNFDYNMQSAIKRSLKMIGIKQNICFKYEGIDYQIPIDDIIYVTTSNGMSKSLIVTDYAEFNTNISLKELAILLKARVIKTHRTCYVNPEYILDINKNVITFKNGKSINLLSNMYKKELLKNV
jgi:DNA-binding LytR/AlgR family response regulator